MYIHTSTRTYDHFRFHYILKTLHHQNENVEAAPGLAQSVASPSRADEDEAL
jgi:hypothetical protein